MARNVMLAESTGADHTVEARRARSFRARTDLVFGGLSMAWSARRRRILSSVALLLGCVFTGLCLLLMFASWHDDAAIAAHLGRADADVLSVSFNRTAVRFVTPQGVVELPPYGVLYPGGLAAGERVRVEYDQADPDLVRVAGRDYRLALPRLGLAVVVGWAVFGPLIWLLRRNRAGRAS